MCVCGIHPEFRDGCAKDKEKGKWSEWRGCVKNYLEFIWCRGYVVHTACESAQGYSETWNVEWLLALSSDSEAATKSDIPMQARGHCNGCARSKAVWRLKLLVHAKASKCILVSRPYDMAGSRPTRITVSAWHDDSARTLCAFGDMLSLRETVYYAPVRGEWRVALLRQGWSSGFPTLCRDRVFCSLHDFRQMQNIYLKDSSALNILLRNGYWAYISSYELTTNLLQTTVTVNWAMATRNKRQTDSKVGIGRLNIVTERCRARGTFEERCIVNVHDFSVMNCEDLR